MILSNFLFLRFLPWFILSFLHISFSIEILRVILESNHLCWKTNFPFYLKEATIINVRYQVQFTGNLLFKNVVQTQSSL